MLIGTHALIYDQFVFKDLGLIVIDEQHKFRVQQRNTLKGTCMSLFAKKSIKEIRHTWCIRSFIEENDELDLKSAVKMYEEFKSFFGHEITALLHGKMLSQGKKDIMELFTRNETKILVSTTVIEVGVEAPDATVLVIEHPEGFGISKLHQLRGRVGRRNKKRYCIILLSDKIKVQARERLKTFAKTTDGFAIAELDLQYRGTGEMLGARQHGIMDFRVADIVRDKDIFLAAKITVKKLLPEHMQNCFMIY